MAEALSFESRFLKTKPYIAAEMHRVTGFGEFLSSYHDKLASPILSLSPKTLNPNLSFIVTSGKATSFFFKKREYCFRSLSIYIYKSQNDERATRVSFIQCGWYK